MSESANRRKKKKRSLAYSLTPSFGSGAQNFLLEIGCEELPADYLPGALEGLAAAAAAVFGESGVLFKGLESFGTPRRLVLSASGVAPVIRKEEKGPPAQVAFDAEGKPTRAAEAFAQKHGLRAPQLTRRQTPKGEVTFAEYELPAAVALAEAVPEIIRKIPFPKTMRWDSSGVRFARPVRWLLCLYGTQTVRCTFGETVAGNVTFAGRADVRKKIGIAGPAAYFTALRKAGVHLEHGKRPVKREQLLKKLEHAAAKLRGRLPDETTEEFDGLLSTVTFLAEDPVVAAGSFRPEYLELPPEVLQTSMAKHLKLFSIRSAASGELLPKFLAVLEGRPRNAAGVMAHYDRILEARFTDARFFYKEDTKSRLEEKVPQLERISFHEKLGTVAQRIPRLAGLMRSIARQTGLRVEDPDCGKAARLCKADLVTQMVREFPTLQGTLGGHYARADGEPAEVAAAIAQQYWPRAAKDPVPTAPLAALVGLADRVDALAGHFGAGLKPTGSADPYGLRRQALGLVRILIEPPKGVSFVGLSFDRLFDESIQSWGARITLDPKTLKKELRAFLRERFEWLAADRDLAAAVLAAGDDDLAGAWERLQLLRRFRDDPRGGLREALERAAKVAERTGRIVQSAKGMELPALVDAAALKDPLEQDLLQAWSRAAPKLKEQLARREYEEATRTYSALYPVVHAFFEKVFVMDEEMNLRRNRLALMKEIHQSLAGAFADLSLLNLSAAQPLDRNRHG